MERYGKIRRGFDPTEVAFAFPSRNGRNTTERGQMARKSCVGSPA
jgi:hypothetical protein